MADLYLCPKCGTDITRDADKVTYGYFGACLECDEDYYYFELKKRKTMPREECRRCGSDASNGYNGLCETCEDKMKEEYGQDCDTTDYD
jgi:hypothetical protein